MYILHNSNKLTQRATNFILKYLPWKVYLSKTQTMPGLTMIFKKRPNKIVALVTTNKILYNKKILKDK